MPPIIILTHSPTLNMISYGNKYTAGLPHNDLIFSKYYTGHQQNINVKSSTFYLGNHSSISPY